MNERESETFQYLNDILVVLSLELLISGEYMPRAQTLNNRSLEPKVRKIAELLQKYIKTKFQTQVVQHKLGLKCPVPLKMDATKEFANVNDAKLGSAWRRWKVF